jgi:hypothetical protein
MNEQWKTSWYPGDMKPLPDRPGVYERLYDGSKVNLCRWTGIHWAVAGRDWESADAAWAPSYFQDLPWRGSKRRSK